MHSINSLPFLRHNHTLTSLCYQNNATKFQKTTENPFSFPSTQSASWRYQNTTVVMKIVLAQPWNVQKPYPESVYLFRVSYGFKVNILYSHRQFFQGLQLWTLSWLVRQHHTNQNTLVSYFKRVRIEILLKRFHLLSAYCDSHPRDILWLI